MYQKTLNQLKSHFPIKSNYHFFFLHASQVLLLLLVILFGMHIAWGEVVCTFHCLTR